MARSIAYQRSPRGKSTFQKGADKRRDYRRNYKNGKGHFFWAKDYAIQRGWCFELSRELFDEIVARPCHYCGLPNNVKSGVALDRLDNSIGYTVENVVSCCKECNYARNAHFTPSEMMVIGKAIRQVKLARVENVHGGFIQAVERPT